MSARWNAPPISKPRRQRGATALEFALIFPALFLLFYGTLTFALIFTARMGLQHAAEEGARSAVTFRVAEVVELDEGEAPPTPLTQIELRVEAAEATALAQAGWISRWQPVVPKARICPASSPCEGDGDETTDCGRDFASACKVVVTLTYNYADRPILPRVPGFGLATPSQLRGQASLLLDGRMLSS